MTSPEFTHEIKRWPIEKLVQAHKASVLAGSSRLSASELKDQDWIIEKEMVRRVYSQAGEIWPPHEPR